MLYLYVIHELLL